MADESQAPAGAGVGAPRRPRLPFQDLLRRGAAALGVAVLIAGCVSAFVLRSDTAAVAVLAAGTALLIVVLILPRLSELNVGTDGVSLKLTMEAAATGAPTAAGVMEDSGLSRFAIAYEIVHSELRGRPD